MGTILWICNRKRCPDCSEECRHTTDQRFAVNPDYDPERFEESRQGDLWEIEKDG